MSRDRTGTACAGWRSPGQRTGASRKSLGRLPVEEGRRQPVVLGARVLVDIADLKSADEFALVVQNTHFIPLGSRSRRNTACQCSLGEAQRAVQRSGIDWDCSKLESAAFFECVSGLIHRLTAVLHNLANPTQSH